MDYYGASIVGIFTDVGVFLLLCVAAYFLYQVAKRSKFLTDKEFKYELMEEMALDKFAKKKDIDLTKEDIKRNIMKKKTFRKEVEEELINDFFEKKKENKKEVK